MDMQNKMLIIPMETDDLSIEMYLFHDLVDAPQAENVFLEFCVDTEILETFQKEGEFFSLNTCIIKKEDNGIFLNAINALAEKINSLGFGEELNKFSMKLYHQLEEEIGEQKYN